MIDMENWIDDSKDEVARRPLINILKRKTERLGGTFPFEWNIEIIYFAGMYNEFKDIYDVTKDVSKILYMLNSVTTNNSTIKNMEEAYRLIQPKLEEMGKSLQSEGGNWLLYGILNIVYSTNTGYGILLNEIWKKLDSFQGFLD